MREFQLEYVFGKISELSLWKMIADNDGLSKWFADSVLPSPTTEGIYIFRWGDTPVPAQFLEIKERKFFKFRWVNDNDDDDECFIQLEIEKNDLTDEVILKITDFCDNNDLPNATQLWNTQVETLKRTLGVI